MKTLLSKAFWLGTTERAIKTFAQSAVALITADYSNLLEVDIVTVASVAGLAALVSVLTRIAGAGESGVVEDTGYINRHSLEGRQKIAELEGKGN